ncbi:DUF4386 domain-containing protein [Demequina sp. SO4-13]|uniref:DUF4386 domain-containing protein n=1 Tax=Demequina sp. SO4-13 TaxID=3401027 RepID=UPI003AF86CC1
MSVRSSLVTAQPLGAPPTNPKRIARVAGLFYLAVAITGGFSEGYLGPSLYVRGDAAATAGNLAADPGLVSLGVVAHLADAVFFVLTAVTLYVLLSHVGKYAARLMVLPVVIAAGLKAMSTVFMFVALQVATTDTYMVAFGDGETDALALLLLEIEHYGIRAAQVFFALWLTPLGYLAYRSRLFPKPLGILLIAATVSYLADVVIAFLSPELAEQIHVFFTIVPAIAEIWMLLYLLTIGVRSKRTTSHRQVRDADPIPK